MTEAMHEQLLDRMPEVARGAGHWSPLEAAHLAACAECREAWDVVRAAASLGRGIEGAFGGAATADRVVGRLRAAGSRRADIRRWSIGIAAAAAAAGLFLATRAPRSAPPVTAPVAEARFFPELDSLSTDELSAVAEGIDAPVGSVDLIEGQPLYDLDSTQLERVLRSLEG